MNNQIFVKIEEYNKVLEIVKVVKEKIAKAEDIISKVSELKAQEDEELKLWNKNLETVKEKVKDIEKELSEVKNG
ncbi:MAG: hypothetical protein KJ583_05760 [Nanoarchaeota archaeon]|nr:hypothetical protein [Nanoarchaeota archaeon]MBU1270431.1 hypothetical protein [Nanoarchaeota archaeon]MBU1604792.1 hypothetical protein [Nanoarchaeota archaeon]